MGCGVAQGWRGAPETASLIPQPAVTVSFTCGLEAACPLVSHRELSLMYKAGAYTQAQYEQESQ